MEISINGGSDLIYVCMPGFALTCTNSYRRPQICIEMEKNMKKTVYVKIKGMSDEGLRMSGTSNTAESTDDAIEVISVASYAKIGNSEYIKYDEVYDGISQKTTNIIKISEDKIEVTKKGAVTTHMTYIKNKQTTAVYETPFGNMNFSIFTRKMDIDRTEDSLKATIEYSMDVNGQPVSENWVEIEVTSQGPLNLT